MPSHDESRGLAGGLPEGARQGTGPDAGVPVVVPAGDAVPGGGAAGAGGPAGAGGAAGAAGGDAYDRGQGVVTVEGDGRLVATDAARQRLAPRAGAYRIVAEPGDLILLARVRSDFTMRVALSGEIDEHGALAAILNFLHFAQWDGALTVVFRDAQKTLAFRRGQLLAASSTLAEDRLGALLVRAGRCQREDVDAALAAVAPGQRLGDVLVQRGLLSPAERDDALRSQVEEIFHSSLLVQQGVFFFVKQLDEDALPVRLQLDAQALLFEGLRRIDEMGASPASLSSLDSHLSRRAGTAGPGDGDPNGDGDGDPNGDDGGV